MVWLHKRSRNRRCSGAYISLLLLCTGKALRHGVLHKRASWPWCEPTNRLGLRIGLWLPASEVLHWFFDLQGPNFPLESGQTHKALP